MEMKEERERFAVEEEVGVIVRRKGRKRTSDSSSVGNVRIWKFDAETAVSKRERDLKERMRARQRRSDVEFAEESVDEVVMDFD